MAIRREPRVAEASEKDAAPTPQSGLDTTRVVASLAVVLGLIFALKHFGKRMVGPRPGVGPAGVVQVLTRQPLGPRQQVVLLRVGRRVIVVADAAGKMSPLSEITDADEVAALVGQVQQDRPASATKAFGTLLGRANDLFASTAAKRDAAPAAAASAVDDDEDEDDLANVESLAVHETRRDLEQLLGRIRGLTPPDRNSSSSIS
jgi:flagellar biogenesis protein FliO